MVKIRVEAGNTITTVVEEGYVIAEVEGTVIEEPGPDPDPDPDPDPEPDPDELIDVRDFGARDGQDSTNAWQQACDAAAGTDKWVVGHEGDTYVFSHRGTVPMGVYTSRYCVGLRPHTKIDGRGCTIKLADNAAALCFANLNQNSVCRDLDIRNIRHDGNRSRQPDWSATAQEIGLIGLWNFADVKLAGLDCWEVRAHAARILQGRRLHMFDCFCRGCSCDVWSIGLDRYLVYDAHLEKIGAEDVRHRAFRGTHQGNPYIGSIIGGTLLDIYGKDAGGGHKYQGVSRNLKVGHSKWLGRTHGTANCGSKFQGNQTHQTAGNRVRNVEAEFVESEDCPGEGLRFSDCENVHVKHYIGRRNGGPVGQYPDVRICHITYNPKIDELESYDSKGHALHIHSSSRYNSDVRNVAVGDMKVERCAGDAVANFMAGCVTVIDTLECRGVSGRHAAASGSAQIRIGTLRADKPQSISGNVTVGRFEAL